MSSSRLVVAVLFSLSGAIGVACGGSGSGSSQGSGAAASGAQSAASGPLDACTLLKQDEVAAMVGNPVGKGEHFAGSEVCKWDAEAPNVSVLLTVRRPGSIRERALCPDLGKSTEGKRLDGIADVAIWKFSNTMGLFNSGDLETCGPKGYVSLSLNGKQDEAKLKQATEAIVRKVLEKL